MNKGIAHILMYQLKDLPFIQRFGGLASVVTKTDSLINEGNTRNVIHKFPVSADYIDSTLDCPTNGLINLTPNSGLTGLMFFEDYGCKKSGRNGRFDLYDSRLRLIVWLNTSKLINSTDDTALDVHSTTTIVHAKISQLLKEMENKNYPPYGRVRINEDSIVPQGENIFGKYSFDEANTQYLMPPFEHYAVDLTVKFMFNPNCVDDMIGSLVDFECNPQMTPAPVHYPKLNEILQEIAPRSLELIVGTDIETGIVVHILRAGGLGEPDKPIALSEVHVLGIVLMNTPIQKVKINALDDEALDFSDTETGGITEGVLTITFRKKSINV